MIYEIIPPCAALRDTVSHFWTGSWDAGRQPNTTYFVIAGTCTELTFAFSGGDQPEALQFALLQGHTQRPDQRSVAGFHHLLGVSIYAHAVPRLFGVPAATLSNQVITLETLMGIDGRLLSEKMAAATTTAERITLLTTFFLSIKNSLQQDLLMIDAIGLIKNSKGRVGVDTLARDFCLSEKQFGRRFKAAAGFNPKTFARIVRFESVLQDCMSSSRLTGTAYDHGYYDQAHFIHEFRTFSTFTPGDFRRLGAAQ